MVDRKSDVRSSGVGGNISHQLAAQPALAQISVAETASQIGAQADRVGQQIIQQNNQFKQAVIDADNTAVYANSMNQATIAYQNLFQERINQQVDQDGNPTFSTLQDDVAQIGRDVSQEILNTIDSPEVRAQFQQNFGAYSGNQQIASIGIARNQQMSFISESVSNSVADLGSRAGAANEQDRAFFETEAQKILDSAVASGAMTPDQRFIAQDAFRKQVSTAVARNAILENPQLALETIENTPADELGMTELERLSMQREAQVAATREERAAVSLVAEQSAYLNSQLNEFERIIDLGGNIPEESIDSLTESVVGTEFEAPLMRLLNNSDIINDFTMSSPAERQAILNNAASSQSLDIDSLELVRKLNSIDTTLNAKIDNDVYSLAIEQRIIDPVQPFDANGDIKQQLADRQASIGTIERHYDVRTSALTNQEINAFQESYRGSDYQRKAQMLGDVIGGLGQDSLSFLEHLAESGSTNTAAIGSLFYEGNSATATTVLKGQDILKNQSDIIPRDYIEVEENVLQNTLPFYDTPQQQEDIRDMAKAIYASNAFEAYDFGEDTDKDRLTDAISQVSNGGAISYNNNNVEPPVNGMTANEFRSWIRTITPDDINRAGGWKGFNDVDIPGHLDGAELLTQGRGQYLVFLKAANGSNLPILNNQGDPFVLDYNVIGNTGLARNPVSRGPELTDIETVEKSFEFNRTRLGS